MRKPIVSTSVARSSPYYLSVRQDWQDRHREPILEGDRLEAAGCALQVRPLAALAQDQEPGGTGGAADREATW
jgi:hypothetical protein